MRVLVLGSGAHEHPLAAGFAAGQEATDIICAPVIVASREIGRTAHADPSGPDRLLHLAAREHGDLTIVGPELP
jgi:phosphoribosylamine-glycine ligase